MVGIRLCMAWWAYDYEWHGGHTNGIVGIRLYGIVGIRLYGMMGIRLCMAWWLYDSVWHWLAYDCMA